MISTFARLRRRFVLLCAMLAACCVNASAQAGLARVPPSALADLKGRHPEVYENGTFRSWLTRNGIARWHEGATDSVRRRMVVIEGADDSYLFAAQVRLSAGPRDELDRTQAIDTKGTLNERSKVVAAAKAFDRLQPTRQLHSLRPVITFTSKGYTLRWEAEFLTGSTLARYEVQLPKSLKLMRQRIVRKAAPSANPAIPPPEELADNELHHLDAFRAEALAWTSGTTSVQEQAQRIYEQVRRTYSYDGTIVNIEEFTWSDLLTRDLNGRRGVCDEYAVVAVTYLRALGVPARLKFLVWKDNGKEVAHAALEYRDGATWKHLDALWGFNDPGVYRKSGGVDVTVIDADYPLDARSTLPSWGIPDPTGDGRLNPYEDYVLSPKYPGEKRPGYSW